MSRKLRTFLAIAALLAAVGVLLRSSGAYLLTRGICSLLEQKGFGPVALTVDRLGVRSLHARDITLYGGAIQARELSLAFSPGQIVRGHVGQVTVSGLLVQLESDGKELTLGGRLLPLMREERAPPPGGGWIPARVRLAEARLVLKSSDGGGEVSGTADLDFTDHSALKASFALDVTVPMGGASQGFRVETQELSLLSREEGGKLLRFAKAGIVARDLPWAAKDVGGQLQLGTEPLTFRLGAILVNRRQPAAVVPVRVLAEGTATETRLAFSLEAKITADPKQPSATLRAKGHHDISSAKGSARITVEPHDFHRSGTQPADFFPVIGDSLPRFSGSTGISGTMQWQKRSLTTDLVLRLVNVSTEVADTRFSGVGGDIRFVSLWPPATLPGQVLQGSVEAGGLPASETAVTFQLLENPALKFQGIRFGFAGGTVAATPFRIDSTTPEVDTILNLDGVDLARVLQLIGVDGLAGAGRIRGKIPLHFAEGKAGIGEEGQLEATEPGILRFRSNKLPKELTGAGRDVRLALQALDDFHYESLTMDLKKESGGKGTLLLKLRGKNPAVLDGHPFHFNVTLESDFDKLTDLALRSMTATRQLLLRAERSSRP